MSQKTKVLKFGGASVKDAASVRNMAKILEKFKGDPLVVVVSAMAKYTNALEKVVYSHIKQDGRSYELLEEVKKEHLKIMSELFEKDHPVFAEVNDIFVAVEWTLDDEPHANNDFTYDQIVSTGELVSSKIIAAFLNRNNQKTTWLDARDIILTDDIFREGWVKWEQTLANAKRLVPPILEKGEIALTQGFIGSTSDNYTTTLGREGSDYTAAIFAYCLDAKSMSIWKDVPGVLTADPHFFENVSKIERLSYREAIEMTYYGARVIHPKTIKPLQNKSIPLYVKSFKKPEENGTFIGADVDDLYPPLVAVEKKQALLTISTRDFSFVAEHHISHIFNKVAEYRLQVNLMQNTAISFNMCVNDVDDKVLHFADSLKKEFKVVIDREELELITVRHANAQTLDMLREGKLILVEERLNNTVQMVTKAVPVMKRKG